MSSISHRANKRRRRKPTQAYTQLSAAEERFFQQAMRNSKVDTKRPGKLDVAYAPTFYPTIEDMEGNPLDYVEKIRPQAEKYGICKISPPKGWNPPFCVDMDSKKKFQTKEQLLHRLQEGISFGDGEEYTAFEYQQNASIKANEWKMLHYPDHDFLVQHAGSLSNNGNFDDLNRKLMTPENLERDYWNIVETHTHEISVDYGNDVDTTIYGSGFPLSERGRSIVGTTDEEKAKLPDPKFDDPDYYKETWWNLNNIPCSPDSVLHHVRVGINGINVPWLYHGCLFSTFCWHNEDNYLYSINYHHKGAPKQWYGIPGTKKDAEGLEKVFKRYLSMKMRDVPDLLHHITTMFSPRLLQNDGVPVYKVLQYPGEFVITFPMAFHGGFSMGPNVGEAVNFATHDWIAHGSEANERYRSFARPAVFSHDRLTFTMGNHLINQKCYRTCKLLLEELERVVSEELRLRRELVAEGVRDVAGLVTLPANRLDQLDEESADYDDKRLCHACKHVCFFSAVACECSQSKVSCLRHSHYMCRCAKNRRYLLIWSDEKEMTETLRAVRTFCQSLKTAENHPAEEKVNEKEVESTPEVAPGVKEDLEAHAGHYLSSEPVGADLHYVQDTRVANSSVTRSKLGMGGSNVSRPISVTSDEGTMGGPSDEKDSSDDDVALKLQHVENTAK
ncbi:transcription factor [Fragilaria crotonensis]|nr:transcription factor [Fragilaria crotonensis]